MSSKKECKMYLFVNKDLKMSTGKIAGQVGHCVGMIVEKVFTNNDKTLLSCYKSWSKNGMKKIVLKSSEKDLKKLIEQRSDCEYVKDEGLTQISEDSLTVVGVLTYECFDDFTLL